MKWIKHGLIYCVSGASDWAWSHAHKPAVLFLDDDTLRIYFGVRDKLNRTRTTFIDVDQANPLKILYEHDKPVLDLGKIGTFDDAGANVSCLVRRNDVIYMYYIGWNPSKTVPTRNSIGLAASEDNGLTFKRVYEGPILDRTPHEPYYTGDVYVLVQNGTWKMWYTSGTRWKVINGKPEICYHIKYAESSDGVNWNRPNVSCILPEDDNEVTCKSSVVHEDGYYRMWYSFRKIDGFREDKKRSYRIGYAESNDGKVWARMDKEVGIDVSQSGWDSQMISFPAVYRYGKRLYMIYSGNGFGSTGFGLAHLEE